MLSEMVASKAPTFGHLNEFEPLSVKLLQRYFWDSFEMIENPKLALKNLSLSCFSDRKVRRWTAA
jgi:hypothetical protein